MNRRAAFRLAVGGSVSALASSSRGLAAPASDIAPLQTEFTYEALVEIKPAVEVGPSSHGTRRYIPITGGSFHGPKIQGSVLSGGADWQLTRPDGVTEIDALYSMKADDGAVIIVRNRGIIVPGGYFRTVPSFEAPSGPHDWLNQSVYIGSVAGASKPGAVIVRVFRVL